MSHPPPTLTPSLETLSTACQLIVSLLRHWPHEPQAASPSLLLCGPSGSGKTFLAQQAAAVCMGSGAPPASSSSSPMGRERVLLVAPSLAPALTIRLKDGSTGLRRLLRESIGDAIVKAALQDETAGREAGRQQKGYAVLVVLDRLEFFVSIDGESGHEGDNTQGKGGSRDGGDDDGQGGGGGGGVAARHPAFLTDLYTTLRSSPPLFSAQESAALPLRRLVFVSLFSGELDEVHPFLRDFAFDHVVSLPTPNQAAREDFFARQLCADADKASGRSRYGELLARALALRTGGLSYRGLTEVVAMVVADDDAEEGLSGLTPADTSPRDAEAERMAVAAAAHKFVTRFQASATMAALDYRANAGYVDVQHTRWSDIAGMADAKKALQDVLTRPLTHLPLYQRAGVLPSKGILLHGPPGTGKTMLAKAIATELNASFVYLDLPSLVQCEVGESERKLNNFFAVAKERSPTVLFVDELQAAFGSRYSGGGGGRQPGQASSAHDARLVSHLLQLLDAAQADEEHVIVFVGATNVVGLLDPLLLRAGRLDTHIEVGLPDRDARHSLARRVVQGDWAAWWRPLLLPQQQQLPSTSVGGLQEALVAAFVAHSENFSGAELRNATSVFALKLMHKVADAASVAGSSTPPARLDDTRQVWSEAIVRLLWSSAEGEEGLSELGSNLVRVAFANGKAPV